MELIIETGAVPVGQNQNTPIRSLAELEQDVQEGLAKYQAVGAALDEIHSRRLYKPEYPNFRTYLLKRWNISRAHGYRLIAAARLAAVSPIGDKLENEYRARKLIANKRVAKRRATTIKSMIRPMATTASMSKLITDLDVEFESFKAIVARWEKGLSQEDYGQLVERMVAHLENARCGREVAA